MDKKDTSDIKGKKNTNASLSLDKKVKANIRNKIRIQKNQLKLEEAIAKKIEEADKKEKKLKNNFKKAEKENIHKKHFNFLWFLNRKKQTNLIEKEHINKTNQQKNIEIKNKKLEEKAKKEELRKEKLKIKLEEQAKNKKEKEELLKQKKLEEQTKKELLKQKKLEEKAKKEELKKEKVKIKSEEQAKNKKENVFKEEFNSNLSTDNANETKNIDNSLNYNLSDDYNMNNVNTTIDSGIDSDKKIISEEEKRLLKVKKEEEKESKKQKKLAEKAQKEELRKEKLKAKFEEQARKKKEKEDKTILLMTERKERENKLKREREQAKKERKEKEELIRKAKEENKQKEKKERKPLKEKISDIYNNISFVKDRQNRREMQRQALMIDFDGADAVRSEEKVMYKYVAKNNETGKVETGFFAAFSKLDVHSFLLAENYEVYEITPQVGISKSFTIFSPKFKATELDFFLTQLSTFLKSGITLVESVKILSKQTKKKSHKNVFKSIIYELTMGENFSEALSKQGDAFPRLLINMVKTAELTGDLPETLDDMASYYRQTDKTKKQMVSAMTYPVLVLVFALGILIFMMISVVPQFVSIYNDLDTDLPGITKAIIRGSEFLKENIWYVAIGLVLFVIIFIILFKTIKVFKSLVQTLLMNIPIIGKIIIYNEVTMFTKTFASLLNHNVYITDCMDVLSKITNNEVYKMMIFDTITNLARGEAISNSFKNLWAFPTIAYEMILTGEKTGQLGPMMDKVANYYQEQHSNAVNQIKAFIEPVMIIILAAIVGVILMSIVIPMFGMYETLSQQA